MANVRLLFRFMLLPCLLMLVGLLSLSTLASAAPASVVWSGARNLSSTPAKSVYAAIAADGTGNLHATWLEYGPDGNDSSRLMYTNNVGGDFFAPYEVTAGAGKNRVHIVAIAAEANRAHLFYTGEGPFYEMRHHLVTLNGATPTRGPITTLSQGKGYAPGATIDKDGRVHAAWIDNRTGTYNVYHRIWENGGWQGSDRQVRGAGLQDFPSLAATDDGRMHMLFKSEDRLAYSVFEGGQWRNGTAPQAGTPNQQMLTSDGTSVYAAWSESTGKHEVYYSKNTNGSWPAPTRVSDPSRASDFPATFFSRANNKLYVIWAAGDSTIQETVAVREITPEGGMSDIATVSRGVPSWPRGAAGRTTAGVIWQDKTSGEEARLVTANVAVAAPSPTPTEIPSPTMIPSPTTIPVPAGQLTVAQEFRTLIGMPGTDSSLNVVVTSTGGPASTLRLAVDGVSQNDVAFTPDAEGKMTIPLGNLDLTIACEEKTVTGVLTGPGGTSAPFSASIFVDGAVDATVEVRNPHLSGDQQPGSAGAQLAVEPADFGPVDGGEPGYTRDGYFDLNVRSRSDECAGLKSVAVDFETTPVQGTNPVPSPDEPIFVTGEIVRIPFPSTLEGVYTFKVILKDLAGNTATYPATGVYSIVYDSTRPVVALPTPGQVPQTGGPTGIATLSLDGLAVRDDLYPNANSTAIDEYSGYWVVVKKQSATGPTDAEWLRSGHVVRSKLGGTPTQLAWNVGFGMIGPFEAGARYQVYVRFLDGAGNASNVIASVPFQVNQLQVTKIMFPRITR